MFLWEELIFITNALSQKYKVKGVSIFEFNMYFFCFVLEKKNNSILKSYIHSIIIEGREDFENL